MKTTITWIKAGHALITECYKVAIQFLQALVISLKMYIIWGCDISANLARGMHAYTPLANKRFLTIHVDTPLICTMENCQV